MIRYAKIPTEKLHRSAPALDALSVREMVRVMNRENLKIPAVIAKQSKNIEKAILLIEKSFKAGGNSYFIGAGTSGRLGVLEAAELPPTFNVEPKRFQAMMAGGPKAVFRSKEGAEDEILPAEKFIARSARVGDIVIGIAASGVTPFVEGAFRAAKRRRAKTILVTCNPQSPLKKWADVSIALDTGPEIITGSTRLKAGTATKMALNLLTTLALVRCGKTYRNRMVDVQVRSRKLQERALRLLQELGGVGRASAEKFLDRARGNVKTAIVMVKKNLDLSGALRLLEKNGGFLEKALAARR